MRESDQIDPLLRVLMVAIAVIILGFVFLQPPMPGGMTQANPYGYHYSGPQSYGLGLQSILVGLSKLLLLVSGIGFVVSIAAFFVNPFIAAEKQQAPTEEIHIAAVMEADKKVEQSTQNSVEPEEKDDLVERLYQSDANKAKKNNKKNP